VTSGFKDPYEFFFHAGILDIFPYPSVMLWILAAPRTIFSFLLSTDYSIVGNLHLLIYRLPVLLADLAIFIILVRWLKTKQTEVLRYYWCSPILFYISYIHGQLDAIPIAILFVSLYLLFKEKLLAAFVFLGLAVSAKTGMLIVLPFAVAYLARQKIGIKKILILSSVPVLIFLALNAGYIASPGFTEMVLKTPQEFKVFDFKINFGGGFVLYLVPFAYLLLLVKSFTYKTYNRDIFLMFLGFSFGILTFFIPPMQGWYYWVLPFLIYFYVKQDDAPMMSLFALNIFYFLYFMFIPDSDLFRVFSPISDTIASYPNLYAAISSYGYNPAMIVNSAFSVLQAALALNVFWIYKKGIESTMRYKISYKPYLIGLSGDSGSGKTTVARLITDVFGEKNTAVAEGDDMHKWERGHRMWDRFTHLDPRANNLHADLEQAMRLGSGDGVERRKYDHGRGRFTLPEKLESKKVIIFEGLHSLFLTKMRDILDLKIFLHPDEDMRVDWKVGRDMRERGYDRARVLEQLAKRGGDSDRFIKPQERYSNLIISLGRTDSGETNLRIKCANHINMDPLLSLLGDVEGVSVSHLFSEEFQEVEVGGAISREKIDAIAFRVVPELWDVVVIEPKWAQGYDGLIQLFICYHVFESMKIEEYEKKAF
jgi:uridine kinase